MSKKNFLIGFMGSGKSHWGRIWAERTGLIFYDLDEMIEEECKMSIATIFEKEREEKFRELEKYHLRKLEKKDNFILACGGGTPCYFDNIEWMKLQGKVFYLKADPHTILQRLSSETEKRPVIKNIHSSELLFFIQAKLEEREPYYSMADITMNVEDLNENSLSIMLRGK